MSKRPRTAWRGVIVPLSVGSALRGSRLPFGNFCGEGCDSSTECRHSALQGSRVLVYPLVTLDRRSKLAVMGRKRGLLEYQYCMGAETRLEGFCMRQYVSYVLGAPKLYTGTYYAYCTDCLRDCFPHCYFQYDQMPMLSCTVNYE